MAHINAAAVMEEEKRLALVSISPSKQHLSKETDGIWAPPIVEINALGATANQDVAMTNSPALCQEISRLPQEEETEPFEKDDCSPNEGIINPRILSISPPPLSNAAYPVAPPSSSESESKNLKHFGNSAAIVIDE